MRDIKVRGLAVDGRGWIYGSFVPQYNSHKHGRRIDAIFYTEEDITYRIPVKTETVGEFTGLKDKNGKDIYERDIIDNKKTGIWQVVWDNGAFKFKIIKGKNIYYSTVLRYFDDYSACQLEVIGNIYENAEMIKEIK